MKVVAPCTREAVENDLPAIEAIAAAAYEKYLDRMDAKPFPMLDDYATHIRRGRVRVLEEKGVVFGYIVFMQEDENTVLLDNVGIHPDAQGKGYGRALVQFAEEWAKKLRCKRMCLYTNEVMTENLGWYKRLGYFETGRVVEKGYKRIYMAKDLDAAL